MDHFLVLFLLLPEYIELEIKTWIYMKDFTACVWAQGQMHILPLLNLLLALTKN